MLSVVIIASILLVDQVTKLLSERFLSPLGTSMPLIEGVFHFTSAHNEGAAWGLMQGFRWLFIPLTILLCGFMLYCLIRYYYKLTVLSRVTLSLLIAGAIGNVIDRIVLSYVRDFLDFCLIQFPIFNVADSALTIGCILMVIDVLFSKDRSLFDVITLRPSKGNATGEGSAKDA